MATFDHPSDLVHRIAYQPTERRALRIDSPDPASLRKDERQVEVRSIPQRNEVDEIFYFIERRPRNPWAAIASWTFLSAVVLGLIVIPLFHADPLPKRETFTMLYLQPPPAAGANTTS